MKTLALILSIGVAFAAMAGVRGPGPYNGIVFFDRWGGCYLYSGVYVMYVSEASKVPLRPHANEPVLIHATAVIQRHNPGDGLITAYRFLGAATETPESRALAGLGLKAIPDFSHGSVRFFLSLFNSGSKPVTVLRDEVGITLLARRPPDCPAWACPSDGPSMALLTRTSLGWFPNPAPSGQSSSCGLEARWSVSPALADKTALQGGSSTRTTLTLKLPPGQYQFLFGYGGGVHSERPFVSNAVSFDISPQGRPRLTTPGAP